MNAGKLTIVLCAGLLSLAGRAAPTVYVNASHAQGAGNGLSPEAAFHTIQEGVEAVDAGGTVYVAPGVYNEGVTFASNHNNRVFIDKSLTLVATGDRTNTEIVGAKDPSSLTTAGSRGMGPNAVRCIFVATPDHVVTIKGFTIRDGATKMGSELNETIGGGVSVGVPDKSTASGPSYDYKTTLVDCAVVNCSGTRGGGTRRVRAVRTIYDNCFATLSGSAVRDGQFYWCVFRDSQDANSQSAAAVCDVQMVNCTVFGCNIYAVLPTSSARRNHIWNSYIGLCGGDVAQGNGIVYLYSSVAVNGTGVTADADTKTDSDSFQLMGPAVWDFRPIAGGDLDGTASRDYLAEIPEEYRDKDFLGNAVSATGALHVGAVQATATPASGCLIVNNSQSEDVTVALDGRPVHFDNEYVFAEAWPTQYVATVTTYSGKELWGWRETSSETMKFPELTNTKTLLMPPPSGADALVYSPVIADKVVYVSASGSDDNDGRTPETPFETLQKANDETADGQFTLAHVAAGAYEKGGYVYPDGMAANRVVLRRQVRYLGAGAGNSYICGAADPAGDERHSGCGADAVRCVIARDIYCCVQGFTLQAGHTSIGSFTQDQHVTGDGNWGRGGGFYAMGTKPWLLDCDVMNCSASRGAAAYGGSVARCRFIGNTLMDNADGNAVVRDGNFWGCVFFNNNDGGSTILATGSKSWHCSLSCTSANTANLNDPAKVRVFNSLCYGRPFVGNGTVYFGCVAGTDAEEGCVNAPEGDMRITTFSKAVGAGVATYDRDYAMMCEWSMDGLRPALVDGLPTAGAYQDPLRVFKVNDPFDAMLSETQYVGGEATLELELTPCATRQMLGATVDGVYQAGGTQTLVGADWPLPCKREIPIEKVYSTNWFVNASMPDDLGDGFTPETAKRTLAGVMYADVRAGDTVHLAPGVYNEEAMIQTAKYSPQASDPDIRISSRVVVPDGVTVSGADRETTIIQGEWDSTAEEAKSGCGDAAIRCVCLGDGATLENVTLRGGATCGGSAGSDNNVGGGVIARRADLAGSPLIRNCTITGCSASRGAAGFGGRYVNCRIVGNNAWNNGTLRECGAWGCWFDGNRSAQVVGYTYADIVNCTFTSNNLAMVGSRLTPQAGVSAMQKGRVANCLFLAPVRHEQLNGYHNRYVAGASLTITNEALDVDNLIAEEGALELDENAAPVIGRSIAVDAGDASFCPDGFADGLDLAGNQRVWNAAIDVGAFEADWRARFARDIRPRGIAVTMATPNVRETAAKAVRLTDGARLAATVSGTAGTKTASNLKVRLSGGGTLTVFLNGEPTWTVETDGEQVLRFENDLAENALDFSFAGTDGAYADLVGMTREKGFLFVVH